jgi:hypothetical protein
MAFQTEGGGGGAAEIKAGLFKFINLFIMFLVIDY